VPEQKVSTAIANLLFVLFLVFFSVSIALGAFIYFRHQQTAAELARLSEEVSHAKSRQELQVNLMKGNSRTVVYPHADPRVGFILNPAIRSTAMSAENAVEQYQFDRPARQKHRDQSSGGHPHSTGKRFLVFWLATFGQ
jgi:hypothetical protein